MNSNRNNIMFVLGQIFAPIISLYMIPTESLYTGIAGFQIIGLMGWFIQQNKM